MKKIILSENEKSISKGTLLKRAINDYMNCNKSIFEGLRKVPFLEKVLNEREIRKLVERLMNEMKPYRSKNPKEMSSTETDELKKIFTSYILDLDKRKLFFDRPFLKFFLDQGYLNAAEDFIERAKKEDGCLTSEEIFQAIRNVWIMNSLQIFWEISVKITPSTYAYSMLYPYTDNFLDNPEISMKDKVRFNERLTRILSGEKISTINFHENRVLALVEHIESQFSRDDYPQVFQSVQLIQEAQVESLRQDQKAKMTYDDILSISFFKGGSSVLADAFLVKGELTNEEMHFAFGYGAFLQLLDDLQDTLTDRKDEHQTLFSIMSKNEIIDDGVNRLISYIMQVNTPQVEDTQAMTLMKEVIRSCTLIMVMEAVGKQPKVISEKLYRQLESYSKVRLTFYKEFELHIKTLLKEFDFSKPINELAPES